MINKRLIEKLKDSKRYIAFTVFLNWISLIANVISIFFFANLLENVLYKTHTQEMIVRTAFVVLTVVIIRAICSITSSNTSFLASAQVKKVLREDLYKKLLRLGISYNEKVPTSEVVQVTVEGVEQLEVFFGSYLPQLFYSLLAPISLFVILSFVSFKSAFVLLICVPLIPLSIMAVQKIAKKLLDKYWGIYTQLGDSFLENLQGLTTLKIFEAYEQKSDEMDVEAENFRKITMKVLTMQLNSITIMDLIAFGGAAIGVIVSVNEYLLGNIGFAGAFAIIMLSADFFIPLRLLGSFFHIAINGMAASKKIFNILDLEEPVSGGELIETKDIVFDNVDFSYDEDRRILTDISLKIHENEFISFVGESGSGKSTIASLIMGINKIYNGNILIGKKEIKEINEDNIMENITLVNHNSYLFKGSIRENLLMGNSNASIEAMKNALEKVNLYNFLYEQEGLETPVLENGSNLSGGQRQRLALARSILHDSPIYIFDEVTSSIDSESEAMIMDVIEDLSQSKTVILISHRMANVEKSDRIYVLDNGKVVEKGTHDELLNNKGQYEKMYRQQHILERYALVKEKIQYA